MDNVNLRVSARGNDSYLTIRKLREDGYIPGVLYGFEKSNQLVQLKEKELQKHLKEHGVSSIFNVEFADELIPVKINEVQKDIINQKLIHFDLQTVEVNKKIDIAVPIQLTGQAIGVQNGGTIQQQLRIIKLRSYPSLIPEKLTLNISDLDIGDNLYIKDIVISKDIEVLENLNTMILTILSPQAEVIEDVKEQVITNEPEIINAKNGKGIDAAK